MSFFFLITFPHPQKQEMQDIEQVFRKVNANRCFYNQADKLGNSRQDQMKCTYPRALTECKEIIIIGEPLVCL